MQKTIALVIASQGYQQIEYNVPKKFLTQHGHKVITVSDAAQVVAKDGSSTTVDLLLKNLKIDDFDALVLVGGPGALDCLDNDVTYRLIQEAVMNKKIVAAICISTRILAKSGVLAGKQATGWDGDNELPEVFRKHGVILVEQLVVTDPPFVTAVGPDAAQEFSQALIQLL